MSPSPRTQLAKISGQAVGLLSRKAGLGSGSVMPGRVSLLIEPQLLEVSRSQIRYGCIFVTGTNGKSTTTYYLTQVLRSLGYSVCTNYSGANMTTGLASACLSLSEPVDYGVFEVDEATVPRVATALQPTHIITLNFSRDQMDRYTEIETILQKISEGLGQSGAELIYNYNNLYTSVLGQQAIGSVSYKVDTSTNQQTIDRPVCPQCQSGFLIHRQQRKSTLVACTHCSFATPAVGLTANYHNGMLRIFNKAIGCPSLELAETLAVTALACQRLGIRTDRIVPALERVPPLPAHQLVLVRRSSRTLIELILGKNPDSVNRNLANLLANPPSHLVVTINNNFADGKDTSWLWDVDFECLKSTPLTIYATGQAAHDVALRLHVAGLSAAILQSDQQLKRLLRLSANRLTIIANYTAYQTIAQALTNQPKRPPVYESLKPHSKGAAHA